MKIRDLFLCAGLIGAVGLAACAGPAPMAPEGTAEDEAAIRAITADYMTAFNAGDVAGIVALTADDYQAVAADGTHVVGPGGVESYEGAAMQARADAGLNMTLSLTPVFVRWIDAEHATMGGTFTISGGVEGMPDSGSWFVVAAKNEAGTWQMTGGLPAYDVQPPPMPAEEDAGGM